MENLLKQLKELQKTGYKSLSDLEEVFGSLDKKQRSRKFGTRHIFSTSRQRLSISSITIKKFNDEFDGKFFIISLDKQEPSRLYCFPFWEFKEEILSAKFFWQL